LLKSPCRWARLLGCYSIAERGRSQGLGSPPRSRRCQTKPAAKATILIGDFVEAAGFGDFADFQSVAAQVGKHAAGTLQPQFQHALGEARSGVPICTLQRAGITRGTRELFIWHLRQYRSTHPRQLGYAQMMSKQVSRNLVSYHKSSAFLVSPRRHQGRAMEIPISLSGA
jgi:hypothetical protein